MIIRQTIRLLIRFGTAKLFGDYSIRLSITDLKSDWQYIWLVLQSRITNRRLVCWACLVCKSVWQSMFCNHRLLIQIVWRLVIGCDYVADLLSVMCIDLLYIHTRAYVRTSMAWIACSVGAVDSVCRNANLSLQPQYALKRTETAFKWNEISFGNKCKAHKR